MSGRGSWGGPTGGCWVLLHERAIIQNKTHNSWDVGGSIQVTIAHLKSLDGIVHDIEILHTS